MSFSTLTVALLVASGLTYAACLAYTATRPRPDQEQVIADARYRCGLVPPAPDNQPGIDLADRDACELLLNDPEFARHCDLLWDAIRDVQKGEQA